MRVDTYTRNFIHRLGWVGLGLSEQEREQVLALPAEVQESLYPNVFRFGPAGEQIAVFLEATDDGKGSPLLEDIQKHMIHPVSYNQILKASMLNELATQMVDNLWLRISVNENRIPESIALRRERNLVCLMLNGQHLFSYRDAAEIGSVMKEPVNNILRAVGLPELGFRFNSWM